MGLLKNITGGIQSEVHSQHRILDNMVSARNPPSLCAVLGCLATSRLWPGLQLSAMMCVYTLLPASVRC